MFPEQNYITNALLLLPSYAQFRIANAVRPADSYLFAQFLPEIGKPSYDAYAANLQVHAIMAGLAGTSSNYPPGSYIQASTFAEKTAKIANHVELQEEDIRTLQMIVQQALAQGQSRAILIQNILSGLLNFFDKMVLQPHLDTMEFLRGRALNDGLLDWYNHGIHLQANYNFIAGNRTATRTGNDHYGGSTSMWWTDYRAARSVLKEQLRAVVMHPNTFDLIQANPVNGIEMVSQTDNRVKVRRILETASGNDRISGDTRDTVEIILYGLEATKIDDANPRATKNVPFIMPGEVLYVGSPPTNRFDIARFAIGQGSTPNPQQFAPLGYTHIAPTVEGGGAIGRWGRVFTPELQPWAVFGEAVTNGLPVIDSPAQIANSKTAMS